MAFTDRLKPAKVKAPAAVASGLGLGAALGILAVWGIEVGTDVEVPGQVGAAIGVVATGVVQRFPRIFIG